MSTTLTQEKRTNQKAQLSLLLVGVVSIVMFFAALTSAYIVSFNAGGWVLFNIPSVFYTSTAIILLSSLTLICAQISINKENQTMLLIGLVFTLLLGIAFTFSQFSGWNQLVEQEIFFSGKKSNAAGSFFYTITFMHLAHLLFGLAALVITSIKASLKKYSKANHLGVQLVSLYWHFLTILWVFLLLFLIYIR